MGDQSVEDAGQGTPLFTAAELAAVMAEAAKLGQAPEAKRKWTAEERRQLASGDIPGGFAGPDQSYPIASSADVGDAWGLAGQAADPDAVRRKIIAIAKRHGWTGGLPATARQWAEDHNIPLGKSVDVEDLLLAFGGEIKALGDGKIGGYLVRFTDPEHPDLDGDYFDKSTDFGLEPGDRINVYYNHGLDSALKKRRLGRGTVDIQDVGVWMETQLSMRDEYEKAIYEMVQAGKMGWSSGSMPHLVEREPVKSATHVTHWPIGEGSITPTPAAGPILTQIQPLKTWAAATQSLKALVPETDRSSVVDDANESEAKATTISDSSNSHVEDTAMAEETKQAPEVIIKGDKEQTAADQFRAIVTEWKATEIDPLKQAVENMSESMDKILKAMTDEPAIRKAGYYTVDGGKADPDIKSFGDFLLAVKRHDADRLTKVYSSHKTLEEDLGDTGGYLVPTEYSQQLLQVTQQTSEIISRCRQVPIGRNARNGEFPYLDYFTTPTAGAGGTAMAGGMAFSAVQESGTVSTTQPGFEMMRWQLYKRGGIVPVSSELNSDSPQSIEALLRGIATVTIRNQMERDVIRGNGNGEPLGILNAACAVAVSGGTSAVFAYGDVGNMFSRYKSMTGTPSWIMHPGVWPDLMAMSVATGLTAFVANMQGPLGNQLLTYPILVSEHSPQDDYTGDVILADLQSYLLFMRGEMEVAYSEHAYFTTDRVGWRFIQRMDGMPWLRSTITLADPQGSYTVSPFVVHAM